MTTPPAPAPTPVPTPAPPADPPADKTFSQADLDRIVADRLNRERGKFADYDDLKSKASQFDQLADQNRSEAEKAVKAARDEGRAEVTQAMNARLLRAQVTAAAAGQLADPADAARMLDLAQFKPGADGEFDAAAIKAAVGELVKAKPYLAATPQGQGEGYGGPRGGRPGGTPTLPQQIAEAERSGNTRESMRLKAQYAREQRKQQG